MNALPSKATDTGVIDEKDRFTTEEIRRFHLHVSRFMTSWPYLSRERAERHARQTVLDARLSWQQRRH